MSVMSVSASDYNPLADILEKFHNSEPIVQIIALIVSSLVLSAGFFTIGYMAKIFMRYIRDMITANTLPRGKLLYSIYLGDENQAIIFKHQESSEVMMVKPDLEKLQN